MDPSSLTNFRISPPVKEKLEENGHKNFSKIQMLTYDHVLSGSDLVCVARTCQEKTFAFVLPILESLRNDAQPENSQRTPSVLVLLPSRQFIDQVAGDFNLYGKSLGLITCCAYGGPQQVAAVSGVDIIIGTPVRIKDLIEKGKLSIGSLKFCVLDEVDAMHDKHILGDVEFILERVGDLSKKVETLLFTATISPQPIKDIITSFLEPEPKIVDLVQNEEVPPNLTKHIYMACAPEARASIISDTILYYSSQERVIVFTETESYASGLSKTLTKACDARTLHGHKQDTREVILDAFRSRLFRTLVVTSVAIRNLEFDDITLIIMCVPPTSNKDIDAYIHHSRNVGISIVLYDPRVHYASIRRKIEIIGSVKFDHMSAPQAPDAASTAVLAVSESMRSGHEQFRKEAERLIETSGLSDTALLSKALALASGRTTEFKHRSLLTGMENYVTLKLDAGQDIISPLFAKDFLKTYLSEDQVNAVSGLILTKDEKGMVFDVPATDYEAYLEDPVDHNVSVHVLEKLPALAERERIFDLHQEQKLPVNTHIRFV